MCTGNIIAPYTVLIEQTVYPCVYREHFFIFDHTSRFIGLSLCVQGTCYNLTVYNSLSRFIPVCTGNIYLEPSYHELQAVYPCVYREHFGIGRYRAFTHGLSLCVQGTLR